MEAGETVITHPVASHLRERTREEHALVEQRIDAWARLDSLAGYGGLLALLEGFLAPIEAELAPHVERPNVPGRLRGGWRRAEALRRDLGLLGLEPLRRAAVVPAPAGRDEALGAWYVLEGSRLGGRLLAREARRRLPAVAAATGALEADDPAAGRWPAFCDWLDGPTGVHRAEAGLAGAQATFAALGAWAQDAA